MEKAKKSDYLKAGFFRTCILPLKLLHYAAIVLALAFLLPLALPYMKDAASFPVIKGALAVEQTVSDFVRKHLPTVIGGKDVTRWIVLAAIFFALSEINRTQNRCRYKIANIRARREYEALKAHLHLAENSKILAPLKDNIEKLQSATKGKDREGLLKLFADTKKKLDAMGRDLAFLSIDVVDSTGMKDGEEKPIIEHDFREYKKFVEGKIAANGALKSAWTPDGVMICFPTVNAAVRSSREIIKGLAAFNANVKTMKRSFNVRCGINAGYVYFDDSLPMEEMSDRVIDVAGHMQKHAATNSICIAKPAIEPTEERSGFSPSSRVVDGYEVYMWADGEGN